MSWISHPVSLAPSVPFAICQAMLGTNPPPLPPALNSCQWYRAFRNPSERSYPESRTGKRKTPRSRLGVEMKFVSKPPLKPGESIDPSIGVRPTGHDMRCTAPMSLVCSAYCCEGGDGQKLLACSVALRLVFASSCEPSTLLKPCSVLASAVKSRLRRLARSPERPMDAMAQTERVGYSVCGFVCNRERESAINFVRSQLMPRTAQVTFLLWCAAGS